MKKIKLLLILMLALGWQMVNAQNLNIRKGDFTAKLGMGVLPTFLLDKGEAIVPPVNMTLGYRVSKTVSLNAYLGYSSTRSNIVSNSGEIMSLNQNDLLMLGLRTEAHSGRFDDFEIYGGFMLGYAKSFIQRTVVNTNPAYDDEPIHTRPYKYPPATGKMLFSGFVGGSYYVMKNIGVYAEVGYGVSIFNVGVNFKL